MSINRFSALIFGLSQLRLWFVNELIVCRFEKISETSFKNNFNHWIKYIIFLRKDRTKIPEHILHEWNFFYKCRVLFETRWRIRARIIPTFVVFCQNIFFNLLCDKIFRDWISRCFHSKVTNWKFHRVWRKYTVRFFRRFLLFAMFFAKKRFNVVSWFRRFFSVKHR